MNVVIVDDDAASVKLLGAMVRKRCAHAEVVGFTSSSDALAWCENHAAGIVFVDYQMPVQNGVEFLMRFRALPGCEAIPVVMISGENDPDVRRRVFETGAGFLPKPAEYADIAFILERNLRLDGSA